MPKNLIRPVYQNLLTEISDIYTHSKLQARNELNKILTKAYWQIGKRIVTVEQDNEFRAQYGSRLIERLSNDLTEQHGEGFSLTNLKYIRKFYLKYTKGQPADLLEWSKICVLLTIEDDSKLLEYSNLTKTKGWSRKKLIEVLKSENLISAPKRKHGKHSEAVPGREVTSTTHLKAKQGPLYVYTASPGENGYVYVDVGFLITRQIRSWSMVREKGAVRSLKSGDGYELSQVKATPKDLYTYKAYVERVIDGDTLKLNIDLGFDAFIKETVRLRGINTPEIRSAAGKKAKRFVVRSLSKVDHMIIKSYWEDKFGRYLVDMWVGDEYLNQKLLDVNLAVLF